MRLNSSVGLTWATRVVRIRRWAGVAAGSGGGSTMSSARCALRIFSSDSMVVSMSSADSPFSSPSLRRLDSSSLVRTLSDSAKSRKRRNSTSPASRRLARISASIRARLSGRSSSLRAWLSFCGAASMPAQSNCAIGLLGWLFSGSFFCHQTRS